MSFFNLTTGSQVVASEDFSSGVKKVLPEGTILKAVISKAEWKLDYTKTTDILVLQFKSVGEDHKGFTVDLKLDFFDEKKGDSAKLKFATIDKLTTGGKIVALGQKPTEGMIMTMMNIPIGIQLGMYEFAKNDGSTSVGNYVKRIASIQVMAEALKDQGGQPTAIVPTPKPAAQVAQVAPVEQWSAPSTDEIPF